MSAVLENNGLKQPKNLSPRITWLRDYYFMGSDRKWNNEFTSWTTGEDWDAQYNELSFYIVPETFPLIQTIYQSMRMSAHKVAVPEGFYSKSIAERRAWFNKEVLVNYLPQEILPGDLIAGTRFNIMTSQCLSKNETKSRNKLVLGKGGARERIKWFHDHGFGNTGAVSGHLIPDYGKVLKIGFKGIYEEIEKNYRDLSENGKNGVRGENLRAMLIASTTAKELSAKYAQKCYSLAKQEKNPSRKNELLEMAGNCEKVPWEPAVTFWEAVQSLWMTHMLVMSDENYPGPGVSFGRIDQYLLPYWETSISNTDNREFLKEVLKSFFIHANTAYDALIKTGNNGITAGYGQLMTLSGMGKDGKDMTNDLTYAFLEVIDEMSPILEPKPNLRIHRNSPDKLLDTAVNMIAESQGAPFLLNFDERSMAGMIREAKKAGLENLINADNVFDYAPVGCLENTMVGNDRSGTVDNNLNLIKAIELALNNGKDFFPITDSITGKTERIRQIGPKTGNPKNFNTFEEFFQAYEIQTKSIIGLIAKLYDYMESIRSRFHPTPYLSTLVNGCAEKGLDITQGGAQINLTTLEGVAYASTVDSLLAIKYLVFDKKLISMEQLVEALKNNWEGQEIMQTMAKNKPPKYGRNDDEADQMGLRVMKLWSEETWNYKTKSTNRRFRPGMLSWNYWISDGYIIPATPDGRKKGEFLSNAICPTDGADINGPTANSNSVGYVLFDKNEKGDFKGEGNLLPNGASHTITFNPSILRDPEHKKKFKAFLQGYAMNGGTALQINMLDPDMLIDAQKHPQNYSHLLVRVTGYNAYFTSIGTELQNEVIKRVSHNKF